MTTAAVLIKKIQASIFCYLFLCIFSLEAEENQSACCLFSPPPKWELVAPTFATSLVKITFSKKSGALFPPSLNLTEEPVRPGITLEDYLKAVQKLHLSNKHRWRKLGSFQTKSGNATLTEIDMETEIGSLRILQLIFLKGQTAYLLTGAAAKNDFFEYQKDFLTSFRSFQIVESVINAIQDLKKKDLLEKKITSLANAVLPFKKGIEDPKFQKQHWNPFQKFLSKEFQNEGAYFQLLVLADAHRALSEKLK